MMRRKRPVPSSRCLEYPKPSAASRMHRFNGVQVTGHGDYLLADKHWHPEDAYRHFWSMKWTMALRRNKWRPLSGCEVGQSRGYWITNGMMAFDSWGYNYYTGYAIQTIYTAFGQIGPRRLRAWRNSGTTRRHGARVSILAQRARVRRLPDTTWEDSTLRWSM